MSEYSSRMRMGVTKSERTWMNTNILFSDRTAVRFVSLVRAKMDSGRARNLGQWAQDEWTNSFMDQMSVIQTRKNHFLFLPIPHMKSESPSVAISWEQLNSVMIWSYVVEYMEDVQVLAQRNWNQRSTLAQAWMFAGNQLTHKVNPGRL